MKHLLILALALAPFAANAKVETYKVSKDSKVSWEGSKIGGSHTGTVNVKSGSLKMDKDAFTGGEFEVDMTTLAITDEAGGMKDKLLGHLKSDDFFSVEKNKSAKLTITTVKALGSGKYEAKGDLTIKGIKKPTDTFPVTVTKDGANLKANAELAVDRTLYDIKYRSLKFFSDLGDKVIHDKFKVKADLTASKYSLVRCFLQKTPGSGVFFILVG